MNQPSCGPQRRPWAPQLVQAAIGMSFDDAGHNVGEVGLGVASRSGSQYSFLNAK
jgi:hypothetical protein